jgi:hypothetical protein
LLGFFHVGGSVILRRHDACHNQGDNKGEEVHFLYFLATGQNPCGVPMQPGNKLKS